MWATGRRSAVLMRLVAPAMIAAVTVTAAWTALALAVPALATADVG